MRLQLDALASLLLWTLLGFSAVVHADSGLSGSLQGALHYYYEGSTRVFMPETAVTVQAVSGERASASILVDVITSASISAGRTEDELRDEYRFGPQLSVGKTYDQGNYRFSVDGTGRYSTEDDYTSASAGIDLGLYLNSDTRILRWGISHIRDAIRSNADPEFRANLRGWSTNLSIEQVLNPTMVLVLGYQFGHHSGFLGNPYRSVGLEGAPQREQPPELRVRHGISSRWSWYVPRARLGIHLLCRLAADSWEVFSTAPELRLYKEVTDYLLLRFRYRYYVQSGASFYRENYPFAWDEAFTADFKLAPFSSHTVGLRADVDATFLEGTPLQWAARTTVFLSLDRVFSGIGYGNQIVGTGGGIWRF